jgi:Helix-turn-helix
MGLAYRADVMVVAVGTPPGGHAVRERRLDLGLSQVELASCADMTQPALSRLEAGGVVPTIPCWIAPSERHWHGATSSTLMSHTTTTIGATEFHEAVTEAEYAAANATPRD